MVAVRGHVSITRLVLSTGTGQPPGQVMVLVSRASERYVMLVAPRQSTPRSPQQLGSRGRGR